MNKVVENLHMRIARGELDKAFEDFFGLLMICRKKQPEAIEDVKAIRPDMLILSGNFHDINRKFRQGVIPNADYEITKNKARLGFIQTLEELPQYPKLYSFLENLEEERAWEKASEENTIAGYEAYFKLYPKGKYASETEKIINELKDEIKRKATQEKARREVFKHINEERPVQPQPAPQAASSIDNPLDWWQTIPEPWQKALRMEIGAIGPVQEKHIKRVLHMKMLDLAGNHAIHDLLPIRYLEEIRTLNLLNAGVHSLQGAETLSNLENLNIANTRVTDLSPLYGLKKLRSLVYSGLSQETLFQFQRHCPDCVTKKR